MYLCQLACFWVLLPPRGRCLINSPLNKYSNTKEITKPKKVKCNIPDWTMTKYVTWVAVCLYIQPMGLPVTWQTLYCNSVASTVKSLFSEDCTDLSLSSLQCGLLSPAVSNDSPESFRLLLLRSRVFRWDVPELKTEAKSAQQFSFSLHWFKLEQYSPKQQQFIVLKTFIVIN